MSEWIYRTNENNSARFLLGCREKEGPLLLTVGINPSTASPEKLDPTVNTIRKRALAWGYGTWCTINVYPQRATDPNDMSKELIRELHHENLKVILPFLSDMSEKQKKPLHIWAAWGTLIEKRPYLTDCLIDLEKSIAPLKLHWYSVGIRTKAGHPHHPLYLKGNLPLDDFNIKQYLENVHE